MYRSRGMFFKNVFGSIRAGKESTQMHISKRAVVPFFILILIVIAFTSRSATWGADTPTTAPSAKERTPDDAVTPTAKDPARHDQFMYRIKQGDIGLLFVGDSITDLWPRAGEYTWMQLAPYHPANFGVSGEHTEHVLWRITNGELDGIHPKVVVLMIGTNNIGHTPADQPEWAAAGVTKIVQTIREKLPDSKILLLGVFPRDTPGSVHREAVEKINEIISKLDDGNMIRYLDIGKVFLDGDGNIPDDVMRDKLHPTPKGYELWYNAMKPLLDEMMK
jgi:lysophospholipase L1-like esterase